MPFAGETLPLDFQLLDGDTSKFCRAVVTDPDGTPIAGSPFTLDNLGGGKYVSDAATMPVVDFVSVRYEPFDDAGFTELADSHFVGTDAFRLEVPNEVIVDKLDLILSKLDGLALPGAAFSARVVQDKVREVIQDVKTAKALVEGADLKTTIETDQARATIDQGKLTGNVDKG